MSPYPEKKKQKTNEKNQPPNISDLFWKVIVLSWIASFQTDLIFPWTNIDWNNFGFGLSHIVFLCPWV